MEWTADVSVGDWIREHLEDGRDWSTMHAVVPRGFAAYARILHPASRDRPVGAAWPPVPYGKHVKEWDAFQAAGHEIDTERVTWAATASAFGTTMHALAQWHRIVGPRVVEGEDGPRDAAGWRYSDPMEGSLEPDLVSATASILARHTSTPDDGFVAVWEGWGGIVGAMGYGPSRIFLTIGDESADDDPRHDEFLAHAARDTFNDVFKKPTWQPGILSDEVSRGPRLSLPNRDHVLFRGGVSELADPDWESRVPWQDRELETHGFAQTAHCPSLVWPQDRAWVLVTEVDYDSTIVGGSSELVRALVADQRLEVLPLREGAELAWDADEVNR
ncbi:hypothetical protein [Microbacterium pumilum]|uniref:DUF2716 domain-containing protein n=1 Tax=Microbacterium pumilum TaxID=344165 RepID=A0ABP5DAX6_9MICO